MALALASMRTADAYSPFHDAPGSEGPPDVEHWSEGSSPEDFGWIFEGTSLSAYDLQGASDWDDLERMGVLPQLLDEAKLGDYGPDEFDTFLADQYGHLPAGKRPGSPLEEG